MKIISIYFDSKTMNRTKKYCNIEVQHSQLEFHSYYEIFQEMF